MGLLLALLIALTVNTPCPTEDSTGCTWSAGTQGNGQGQSFIAFTDDLILYI